MMPLDKKILEQKLQRASSTLVSGYQSKKRQPKPEPSDYKTISQDCNCSGIDCFIITFYEQTAWS